MVAVCGKRERLAKASTMDALHHQRFDLSALLPGALARGKMHRTGYGAGRVKLTMPERQPRPRE